MEKARVAELVQELEAEVNNGGFDQYFFNSGGDHACETVLALRLIGAQRTAAILERACSKFPDGGPPQDRTERQELLLEISPDSDAFETEDEAFFRYEEDLEQLLAAYLEN